MDDIIGYLAGKGIEVAPSLIPKFLSYFKKPVTKETLEKEILPMVTIKDGSNVTNEGLMNIFANGGLVIENSTFVNRGVTNIVATDAPATLNIVNKKKLKKGDTIGSISFTNKGIVIDSGDSTQED